MKLRRWFTLLLLAMLPIMAMAQSGTVYPIDLSVMMTPPYGPCLKEYVGSDRINIQALLKDFTKKSDQFVVELKVTDNRNRVVLLTHFGDYDFPAGKTFTYPMGPNSTSVQKSNVLHDLFNNAKIKPKDECFEEGAYTFVFQAFDAHSYGSRKVALSMPFTYPVFLQGNTVQPLQIYPYEHEVICNHAFEYTADNGIKKIATQLGGIAYQWQSANPTGMRVGYHVQVVDLGEIAGRTKENIESAAQSSFGITDKYILDRRTYTPFCNHDFTAANYVEDHAYAWRVMAVTGDALDKEASFTDKNAPVRVFYFCGAPGIEKDDYVVVKDERKFDKDLAKVKMDTIKSADLNALAMWRDSSVKDAYCGVNVEIRKKGQDKWTPYFVEKTADFVAGKEPTDNNFNFENLSYNTHYEVRAQYVKCDNCSDRTENCVYAPYSDIMEFVIDQPIDSAVCGDNLPKLADCGEGSEIPKVVAGDIIIANGTEVVVDSVSYPNASDSSIISGTAHLCMPMIKNIQLKMEFEEIQINCAKELVMGRIKSVWDETTCAMIDLDEAGGQNSTGGKDNPSSDATVEPYDPATASSKPSGTLMVDGNKNVMFRTDKDGEVVTIGKFVSFTSSEYQSTNYLADNTHYVEFYNEDKVNNAFDNDQQGYYRNIKNEYEYFDTPHTNVVLPWLANNPGKQKIIKAREVKKKSTSASFESVLFVIPCESGYIQLETTQDENGNYELNIPGLADVASSTPIYAIARNSAESSYFDAGKMMQANYAERTHKLIIVPTKEEYSADVAKIQEQLNAIYGRVGVTYTVEEDRSFVNDETVNFILEDGLDVSADDESRWQVESSEMKLLRDLYENSHPDMDKKTAYLFLVNKAEAPYESTEGDMPRNQSVGYIFMKNNKKLDDGRVVAHELGHGVYKLQHTFDYDGLADKKDQTDNLMDYNNGDFLAHYQWRVMQDSVMFVWKGLQDDEDGMWTTDGHYYLFTYLAMLKGLDYKEAEKLGRYAERPDTHVISFEDFKERDYKLPDGRIIHLKAGQVIMGDEEIVTIPKGYKVGDMLENTTWLIGGLQQRNHVLTGGKHGIELAATTYAIINRKKLGMESDFEHYLLHRFGDCFAHFDVMNDAVASIDAFIDDRVDFVPVGYKLTSSSSDEEISIPMPENFIVKTEDDNRYKCTYSSKIELHEYIKNRILPSNGEISVIDNAFRSDIKAYLDPNHMDPNVEYFDDVSLQGYIESIETYINENFEFIQNGDVLDETLWGTFQSKASGKKQVYSKKNGKYRTTFDRTELTIRLIKCILNANNGELGDGFSLDIVKTDLLKYLPKACQNTFTMYGANTNIKDFTWGHGSDKGLPDDILRRPKLFMTYVKRAAELIDLMYVPLDIENKITPEKNKIAIERFQKIIDWGVANLKDNAGTKLDAVFAFAIAYEFAIQNKRTEVYIPIKYLPSELRNNPNGDPQHLLTIFFYDIVNGGAFSNPFMMASEEQRRTAEQYVKNHSKILGISSVRAVGLTSTHLVLDFIKQK